MAKVLAEYASVAFSADGVKQDISLDEWKGGWAAIVGGVNGKPTSQQFNMVTYLLSALLNQVVSDLNTVKHTANDALSKEDFTATKIIAALASAGLMEGCNVEMLNGKHSTEFAASKHKHSTSDITSGTMTIERGGTGAETSADACKNLGAMRNAGGTFTGTVYFANGTSHYVSSTGDAHFKSLGIEEDISARRVYNAVWSDYAEYMPRGESTQPGDIIALDLNSQSERYIKATNTSRRVVGVHSDEYACLIGGETPDKGKGYEETNREKYIPIALAGRVMTRVVGPVHTGDIILPSEKPGVGRAALACESPALEIVVGYAVEGDDRTDVRRIRVRVKG